MKSRTFLENLAESRAYARERRANRLSEAVQGHAAAPGVGSILSNVTRASILHLLSSSPDTLYSMQVEELASAIGTKPRLVIYHLERLKSWGLVEVMKTRKYGNRERRSIWGLNAKNAGWVQECCGMLGHFLEEGQLRPFVPGIRPSFRRARAGTNETSETSETSV